MIFKDFKDFKNIKIDNQLGVSPVGKDTMLIAKYASKLKFESALDVGTGTGFIPIYLSRFDLKCDGIDISNKAISCAQKNAKENDSEINFYVSDLFENITKRFELIIFNPPIGNLSASLSKYLEIVKSLLPKENKLVIQLSFQLTKNQRAKQLRRFFNAFPKYLKKNGRVLIYLHDSELSLIKKFSFKIVDEYNVFKLIFIQL